MMELTIKGDFSMIVKTNNVSYVIEGFKDEEKRKLFYRTLGLAETCGLDLEINLSLDPNEAKRIFGCIVEEVLGGVNLTDGLVTSELTNAPVLVQKRPAKHPQFDGEECYRIAFSDEKFKLPTDKKCNPLYKGQLD